MSNSRSGKLHHSFAREAEIKSRRCAICNQGGPVDPHSLIIEAATKCGIIFANESHYLHIACFMKLQKQLKG